MFLKVGAIKQAGPMLVKFVLYCKAEEYKTPVALGTKWKLWRRLWGGGEGLSNGSAGGCWYK